jgi:hypothetical protein
LKSTIEAHNLSLRLEIIPFTMAREHNNQKERKSKEEKELA